MFRPNLPGSYRLRSREAFRDADWAMTPSGFVLPVPSSAEQEEEAQEDGWVQTSPGGLVLPASAISAKQAVRQVPLTGVSLFSGAGGFDLGVHQAGFRILAASDHAPECAWTYGWNLGAPTMQFHFIEPADRTRFLRKVIKPAKGEVTIDEQDRVTFHRKDRGPIDREGLGTAHFFLGDACKLTGKQILDASNMQIGEIDIVFGGPPCQGFSTAGKRNVMDPRNSLVFEFARLILELQPRTFIFENVPGIASMDTPEGVPVLDAFCHMLSRKGYASYEGLKRALEYNLKAWGAVRDQGGSEERMKKKAPVDGTSGESEDDAEQLSLFDD
jgi:DNA (cytosine-5)-methyltransferase 1